MHQPLKLEAAVPQRKVASATSPNLWWFAGTSSALACLITHPLDTLKVRMQMNSSRGKVSMLQSFVRVSSDEGLLVLYKGVDASVLRQLTYSVTRFGVYEKSKPLFDANLVGRIAAASIGGVVGALVGTPADLVNVRMQADPARYKSAIPALLKIARDEGIFQLWTGAMPNVIRAIPMTAGQIATYDTCKSEMISAGFSDNLSTHFISSLAGALVATTLCSPIDVVKSRIMAQKSNEYSGTLDCAVKIARREGFSSFFKGWTPSFARLGPHTILTFIFMEQIRVFYAKYAQ